MRLLLDTHAFLWWVFGDRSLSGPARRAIADSDNSSYISAATAWEIATKYRLGKLPGVSVIVNDIEAAITAQNFASLPVTVKQGQAAGALPGRHRDPFDRMLIAQAILENLVLVSNERGFDNYGVSRLW